MKKMSYDRLGNHRVRERCVIDGRKVGRKRSIFAKVSEIKREIRVMIPEIRDDELLGIMSRCRSFYHGVLHYGRRGNPDNRKRKRELTINEKVVYDYLIRNDLNPSTTYRWFIATRLPSDVRESLEAGKIGQKTAMKIWAERRNAKSTGMSINLIEDIRNFVHKLKWE